MFFCKVFNVACRGHRILDKKARMRPNYLYTIVGKSMTDQIVVWAVPRSFMVPFHIAGTSIDGWNTQIRVIPLAKSL